MAALGFVPRTASTESTSSIIGENLEERTRPNVELDENIPTLYNAVAAIIYCPKHKKYGVERISSRKGGLWLPHAMISSTDGLKMMISKKINLCLGSPDIKLKSGHLKFTEPKLVEVMAIQLPITEKWFKRHIFRVTLDLKANEGYCCSSAKNLAWIEEEDINDNIHNKIWGHDLCYLVHNKASNQLFHCEMSLDQVNLYKKHPLIRTSGYTSNDVLRIYSEYIQQCYPSQTMSFKVFEDYCARLGLFEHSSIPHFFRAFSTENFPFLSFEEFILGLAAADPNTEHGGESGRIRTAYIFRMYDLDQDNLLRRDEFRNLVSDSLLAKEKPNDKAAVDQEEELVRKTMDKPGPFFVTVEQFTELIGNLKVRGTSSMFRSSKSFGGCANAGTIVYPPIDGTFEIGTVAGHQKTTKCPKCQRKKYVMAAHQPVLCIDGATSEAVTIKKNADIERQGPVMRRLSDTSFDQSSVSHIVMNWVRDHSEYHKVLTGTTKLSKFKRGLVKDFNSIDKKVFSTTMNALCDQAEAVLAVESRILKLTSPCTVIGGLHGNLHDLMVFERQLWKKGPLLESSTFLFLGDFVGPNSDYNLMVVMYLLALKVLAPFRVFLIRGNYELRTVQTELGLTTRSREKLGDIGQSVWDRINAVYDRMPMGATIDKNVFCVHGGIPRSVSKLNDLMTSIPTPMTKPESECPAAWEMMWGEPIDNVAFNKLKNKQTDGFVSNTKQGNRGYLFSGIAATNFLKANNLSHIIRTHELIERGIEYSFKGEVISISSSSENGHQAAVILASRGKLRAIRVATGIV